MAKSGRDSDFQDADAALRRRRGMMDAQDRLWFGENNGDRIGMFDTRTERFQEWTVPTPGAWPYRRHRDRPATPGRATNTTIDPASGSRQRRVRRVPPAAIDERATRVRRQSHHAGDFWVGNNHGASIVKLEPLDASTPAPSAPAALFEGARLITATAARRSRTRRFVVENGRFTQVGRKGALPRRRCTSRGSRRQT